MEKTVVDKSGHLKIKKKTFILKRAVEKMFKVNGRNRVFTI